jgi:hypothetical protein
MLHIPFRSAFAAAVLALAGGCATLGDSPQQQLEVHAILDNREVAGVGCVLENDAGRWFVVAPGRVTVERSEQPLRIDCRRAGVGGAREEIRSRYDTDKLIGNAVISAGLGYYVDRRSGAGFSYPATLTVIMGQSDGPRMAAPGEQMPPQPSDNGVF